MTERIAERGVPIREGSAARGSPSLTEIRRFWERNPVGDGAVGPRRTWNDYFRAFDDLREAEDVEPYVFSNRVHDYEGAKGRRVLDYGCGNGYVLARYARCGAEVYGVDVTAKALELSKHRFALRGLRGSFLQSDGRTIPFEDDAFDIVCSMGVLHHVPDPRPVVEGIFRVLRPGGRIIVMVYNRRSFRYHVTFRWRRRFGPAKFRGRTLEDLVRMNDGAENPYGVVYTKDRLKALLAGFEGHTFLLSTSWGFRSWRCGLPC